MHKNVALCEMRKYPICKELSDICVVTQRSYRLGTTDRASNICGNFSRKQRCCRFLLKRTKFEVGSGREGGRGCKRWGNYRNWAAGRRRAEVMGVVGAGVVIRGQGRISSCSSGQRQTLVIELLHFSRHHQSEWNRSDYSGRVQIEELPFRPSISGVSQPAVGPKLWLWD